jgi:hypothetical protein
MSGIFLDNEEYLQTINTTIRKELLCHKEI